MLAATLFGSGTVPLVGHETFECIQQERAEPALLRVSDFEIVFFQDLGEKPLDEVLGIFGTLSAPAGKDVEGVPVGLAKGGQRGLGLSRADLARGENHGPISCCEQAVL